MNPTTITVNPDLLAYIDPLTSMSTPRWSAACWRGCRDALVLWAMCW
jgi:hypothetical protein